MPNKFEILGLNVFYLPIRVASEIPKAAVLSIMIQNLSSSNLTARYSSLMKVFDIEFRQIY